MYKLVLEFFFALPVKPDVTTKIYLFRMNYIQAKQSLFRGSLLVVLAYVFY